LLPPKSPIPVPKRNQLFIRCTTNRFPLSQCASAFEGVDEAGNVIETNEHKGDFKEP
jgi:hypothetical protein